MNSLNDVIFNLFYEINRASGAPLNLEQVEKLRYFSAKLAEVFTQEANRPAKAIARAIVELDDRIKSLENSKIVGKCQNNSDNYTGREKKGRKLKEKIDG